MFMPIESPHATLYLSMFSSNSTVFVKLSPFTFDKVVLLVNAFVLDNIFGYRHKSYILKTRFFGLHSHRREYGFSWL